MAAPTNSFGSYAAIGNREDLSNVIYDISSTETPFVSSIARTTAMGREHEWQTDALASAGQNANIEGDESSAKAITPTVRLKNPTQIFRKDFIVTGTQREVDSAGRADELDYQIAKHGKELKRDIEWAFTGNQGSDLGSATVARTMAGSESWLKSTGADADAPYASKGTGATLGTSAGFSGGTVTAPVDATTPGAVDEDALKTVVKQAWVNGGEPRFIMTGPSNKQALSGFNGIATLRRDVPNIEPGVIIAAADIYVSDFGSHNIVPNRFNRDKTVQVLDLEYWANAELRPFMSIPLAKTGDSDKHMLLTETTLVARQPLSSGKIADLTTP